MTLKAISLLQAVILVTYLTVCQTEQGGCPDDWDVVEEKCFRFIVPSKRKKIFEDAKRICEGISVTCPGQPVTNGALARIPNAAVQTELVDLARGKGLDEDFFIGLIVDGKGKQTWVSGGQSVDYSAWANMNDDRPNTRAVMSFSDSQNGMWKAVDITTKANYLCMLPCVVENIEG